MNWDKVDLNDVYEFIKQVELNGDEFFFTNKNGSIVTKSTSMNEEEARRRYDIIITGATSVETVLLTTKTPKK